VSVPLELHEAKRISKYYEEARFLLVHQQLEEQQKQGELDHDAQLAASMRFAGVWDDTMWDQIATKLEQMMTADELAVLQQVHDRIDPHIRAFAASHGGAFVKLSSRRYDMVPLLSLCVCVCVSHMWC
jgi:hypothetical protein